jgi:hypothetical protein
MGKSLSPDSTRAHSQKQQKEPSRHAAHMRVNIRETVQISSLKGDQISAQGFNPNLASKRETGQ